MKYYLKRLGHQELGSVKNGKAQRGRYIYISKDKNVLDIFPPLSKTVTNDSSIIPIIPLYQKIAKKIYCNYIYHNDKYNVSGGTRNEYRIYCNGALEGKQLLFQPDDILIFRAKKTSSLPKDILGSNDVPEAAVEEANVFFLYRCCDKNSELYRMCKKLVDESNIRGNGHAIYQGIITEVENKINQLCVKNFNEMDTVIEGWSYVKKKYKLNVTNFLCSERSLTCYFYCILLDVFKILFLIFIWRQISTVTVNAHGIIKCFDVFKNQFMCMCIIKDFKPIDPFSLQKCMERFYTGVIPWICFL